ncbi:uncharacterized protein LOC119560595 [Drosophila subpulchrella]|uniref:uncharacterized protein LOC119560595 n=1 Tax=Drosophila subpulchrella TaxID=1486046 RepID=UPI0018A157EA|nr:uncharacterized protein LOC119560595 [Drosophila subpulchrella]
MLIAQLGLFLCILGYVAAKCQQNGDSCTTHSECCSAMCLTNVGQCAPKNGALWA